MDTLLHFALSNALTASILTLPAVLVSRLCQRPALAHGLWLLVILKLLMPPLLPVPVLWLSPPELRTTAAPAAMSELDSEQEGIGPARARPPLAEGSVDRSSSSALPVPSTAMSLAIHLASSADSVRARPAGLPWTWVVGLVWGTGSALWFAIVGWRTRRFQRLLQGARRAPTDLQERACRLGQCLGVARCPGVWFVPGRVSPMLWALAGPPRLLLPGDLWSQLSGTQRDTLLAHELAHLRRRDHWVRWLELAAVGLYWWHPVAWWAERELQEAGEQCCDAWVVAVLPAAADAYAEALLETVAYLSRARAAVPVGASGAGRVHLLKRRLIMILNGTAPKTLSPAGRWTVLVLGAVLLPLWPTWAHSQGSPGNEASRLEGGAPAASPADDPGREDEINQARATVRELSAELKRMRAQVEAVASRLDEAQARLARLEGRSEPPHVSVVPRNWEPLGNKAPVEVRPVVPTYTLKEASRRVAPSTEVAPSYALPTQPGGQAPRTVPPSTVVRPERHGGGDYDQRLREVEAKLDRLLEEFKTLRERQPARSGELRR